MWALLIVIAAGVLWLFIEPIVWWTPMSEVRLCVRLFLLIFAVNTFGTLRLYNSIVQNTRFAIKLREALISFTNIVPGLERGMKNLNSTLGNVKASAEALKKETIDNTDEIRNFTDKITKVKVTEK